MSAVLESLYRVMQDTAAVYCPECKSPFLHLLTTGRPNMPAFYICRRCPWVGEVGVGAVPRVGL